MEWYLRKWQLWENQVTIIPFLFSPNQSLLFGKLDVGKTSFYNRYTRDFYTDGFVETKIGASFFD